MILYAICCVLYLQFHALLLARCPKILDEMNLSATQHVTRLVCQLQTCLLDSRLAGFAPATLALATLSLDLELFVGWHFWLPATVTLQTLAQVSGITVFFGERALTFGLLTLYVDIGNTAWVHYTVQYGKNSGKCQEIS